MNVFDSVDVLHYNLHKISLNRGGSYIDAPKSPKNKKPTINLKNNNDKCFQYAVTVAWNYEQIKKDPQRISKSYRKKEYKSLLLISIIGKK